MDPKKFGLNDLLISPVTEQNFKEPVKRANRSILNIQKAKETIGFNPIDFSKAIAEQL